jgi:hypothetical protein
MTNEFDNNPTPQNMPITKKRQRSNESAPSTEQRVNPWREKPNDAMLFVKNAGCDVMVLRRINLHAYFSDEQIEEMRQKDPLVVNTGT